MVRQAVVKIMLGSMQQRQERFCIGAGDLAEGEEVEFLQESEKGGWGQSLACQDKTSCPSKCILWCAIALGALVQGCSLEYVSRPLLDTKPVTDAITYTRTCFLFARTIVGGVDS